MGSGLLTGADRLRSLPGHNSLLEMGSLEWPPVCIMALQSPSLALINCFGIPFPSRVAWSGGALTLWVSESPLWKCRCWPRPLPLGVPEPCSVAGAALEFDTESRGGRTGLGHRRGVWWVGGHRVLVSGRWRQWQALGVGAGAQVERGSLRGGGKGWKQEGDAGKAGKSVRSWSLREPPLGVSAEHVRRNSSALSQAPDPKGGGGVTRECVWL